MHTHTHIHTHAHTRKHTHTHRWKEVIAAIVVLIVGKVAVMAAVGPLFGLPRLAAIRSGLLLAPGVFCMCVTLCMFVYVCVCACFCRRHEMSVCCFIGVCI